MDKRFYEQEIVSTKTATSSNLTVQTVLAIAAVVFLLAALLSLFLASSAGSTTGASTKYAGF